MIRIHNYYSKKMIYNYAHRVHSRERNKNMLCEDPDKSEISWTLGGLNCMSMLVINNNIQRGLCIMYRFCGLLMCGTEFGILSEITLIKHWIQFSHRRSAPAIGHEECSARDWWSHQMETFSALLALFAGYSPVTGEFPPQRPVSRGFMFSLIDLRLNKWFSKQSTRYRAHYDVTVMTGDISTAGVLQ